MKRKQGMHENRNMTPEISQRSTKMSTDNDNL